MGQTRTDHDAASAALASCLVLNDRAALDAVIGDLPPITLALAGAADLLADVLAHLARECELPGDAIDLAHAWESGWPYWAAGQMGLPAEVTAGALSWLGAWLDGERWLPAADQCAALAVAVTLAAWSWGERPGWPGFLVGREVARCA